MLAWQSVHTLVTFFALFGFAALLGFFTTFFGAFLASLPSL